MTRDRGALSPVGLTSDPLAESFPSQVPRSGFLTHGGNWTFSSTRRQFCQKVNFAFSVKQPPLGLERELSTGWIARKRLTWKGKLRPSDMKDSTWDKLTLHQQQVLFPCAVAQRPVRHLPISVLSLWGRPGDGPCGPFRRAARTNPAIVGVETPIQADHTL